jgi:hypothetical protein
MYPQSGEILSLEELIVEKFKRGYMKILTEEDFEEINSDDHMEMTIIDDRRHSVYPASFNSISSSFCLRT